MFEFSAGSPSLCLVDTVGNRGGADIERLATPQDFTRWLREASLLDPEGREALETDLVDARALRDALYRAALAIMNGKMPAPADIDGINALALGTPPRPQWVNSEVVHVSGDRVRAALALLAGDAVGTLADAQLGRVRLCPECRMMFVDKSPAGRRRWCSSASGCGNRAKVREHRARKSQEGSAT
ncbi:CGNR zinc finger domain-containing protein [Novosphingobium sp.]|uniref:CGNR zinc finger domain-containing protein n=1 Tax=Novosphingobium sp. TaxID=1874826 RepID=UPI0031CEECD7